jgi:hypothetical protein
VRTGKNGRYQLVGLLRQWVFGRLAGYEDENHAERLCRDPAMRWVVGGSAPMGQAAFRGDADFANPEIHEFLEAEGMGYAAAAQPGLAGQNRISAQAPGRATSA